MNPLGLGGFAISSSEKVLPIDKIYRVRFDLLCVLVDQDFLQVFVTYSHKDMTYEQDIYIYTCLYMIIFDITYLYIYMYYVRVIFAYIHIY